MNGFKRVNILGCPFDAISFSETEMEIRNAISAGETLQIVPGNIDMVIKTQSSSAFAQRLWKADLVIADGKPIVWSARLLGNPIRGRVSGTDLVWSCAALSAETGWAIALIGGMGDVAARAARVMKKRYPSASLHAIPTPMILTENCNVEDHSGNQGGGHKDCVGCARSTSSGRVDRVAFGGKRLTRRNWGWLSLRHHQRRQAACAEMDARLWS